MNQEYKPLEGKVAFITGGARGIGAAVAHKLARHGCRLIINYYNSSDVAETLSAQLTDTYGVEVMTVHGSVAIPASVKEMAAAIEDALARQGDGAVKQFPDIQITDD